jgi:ATP-dependent DNA helicase RecG
VVTEGAPRPLTALRGIGPVRGAELEGLGLATVEDLLSLPPIRHEDRRSYHPLAALAALPPGVKVPVRVWVQSARLIRTRRRGFSLVRATVSDGHTDAAVVWYNQPYLARHLQAGREVILYGDCKPSRGRGRPRQMENPELELVPAAAGPDAAIHTGRVVPVYRRVGPLSGRLLRRLIHAALEDLSAAAIVDPLPPALRRELELPDRACALHALHFPPGDTDLAALAAWTTPAQRRLVFEELLLLAVALALKRRHRREISRGFRYQVPQALRRKMRQMLPFPLTAGQRQAIRSIGADLRSPAPMARPGGWWVP